MEKFFVSRPIFAMVISIVIVMLGLISIKGLPVEQYPDITPPVVQVSATYPGADAVTVNDAVAVPVCQSIMGVSDMLYMQSTSANDGSLNVQVVFDIGSDPDLDAIFTQNNVASSSAMLPSSVTQQGITTQKSMNGFLMVMSIYSEDGRYDDNFLANYAYINLQNQLLKIDGVGKVNIMGAGKYSMRVWVNPQLMNFYNLSVEDITEAIESQSGVYPAGKIGAEPTSPLTQFTYTVTMPPQINTAEQYGNIIIKALPDGSKLRLKDIAEVNLGSQSYGTSSKFGTAPSAMIIVYQSPGSNAVDVGNSIKSTMKTLSKSFIDGVEYDIVVDTTSSIKDGINEIFKTLLLALLLVIMIIYLFIQDVKATLIPLIAIPVSLIGAFMLFPLLGFSVNIISLLGLILAIGLVVDDAIVVVEAVQVNIEKGMDSKQATLEAMRSVSPPIIATTVVLSAVFIPVSFMGGIEGKMYQQFSITIAVSVIISAFNALTLSPALCSLLLKPKVKSDKGFFAGFNRWFSHRVDSYLKFSSVIVRHAARTIIFVLVIIGAMAVMFKTLPNGFLPDEDQGYIMVMVDLPDAASLSRTESVVAQADKIITSHKEVASTISTSGFNMLAGISSTSSGIIFVELTGFNKRKISAQELADILNEELYVEISDAQAYAFTPPSIPGMGMTSGVTFMVQDRQGRGITYLAQQTDSLLEILNHKSSIASASTQFDIGVPARKISINEDFAQREGVSMQQIHTLLATYLGGTYMNNFNRFGKLYQSYIQAAPQFRQSKEDLSSYFVLNSDGKSVPLSAFVEIIDTTGVEYITLFNLYNSIDITATPAKGYTTTQVMNDIQSVFTDYMPDDIGLAWSGTSLQESSSSSKTWAIYLLALAFVFLTLAALYNSWALPLSILLGVPMAIFGALVFVECAHLIDPTYIDNLFMQVSLIMLIGLSAKNAILIIEYANREFFENGASLSEAAISAARLRVRPIIMTATAFILGVLPLVFAHGAYSTARNIMGLSLVGGMFIATLLGIFVYPALYYAIAKIARFDKKREKLQSIKQQ